MRFLFIRIFVPLLVFWLLRSLLKTIFAGLRAASAPPPRPAEPPPIPAGGELKKDPVCGTYVSVGASITRSVGGQVVHFCSKECRDKYKVA